MNSSLTNASNSCNHFTIKHTFHNSSDKHINKKFGNKYMNDIYKIPNKFYNNGLKNIFFLTSLNGRSLFLLKFDNSFQKLIFNEKIFIGERIRDIIYVDTIDKFVLSFDGESALGIISRSK